MAGCDLAKQAASRPRAAPLNSAFSALAKANQSCRPSPGPVVRLVEIKPQAQHAGRCSRSRSTSAIRLVQRRVAENRKALRVCQGCLGGLLIGIRIPACGRCRMAPSTPASSMRGSHPRPDRAWRDGGEAYPCAKVDLRVDDGHSGSPFLDDDVRSQCRQQAGQRSSAGLPEADIT